MVSEASDEVSPVYILEPLDGNRAGAFLQYFAHRALELVEASRRQAEAQPLYLAAAQKEATHRQEILRNRSNYSETPIEISPDKLDVSATPSCVPVISENLTALDSEKPLMNVDSLSLPLSESVVVYSSDNIALPPAENVDDTKETCSVIDTPVLPTTVETVDLSSPHKYEKTGGIPVYTATSLGESLEHVRLFAGLPSDSIPQPYRVIHPSESSSEDDKILAKVYGSQALQSDVPTVESPTKETRRSKRKNVPVKVVVETGDDNADVDQLEKKKNSTLSVRKGKPSTRSRGRSITPEVPPVEETDPSVYRPQFVSPAAQTKWATMVRRDLIVQRSVDENQLNSVCDILPLLNEVGLLKTVTDICPYSKLLTYEFYFNLNDEIDVLTGPRPMQIFIRGRWYVFWPDMINEYYGLPAVQEEAVADWDLVARTLTGGQTESWPTGDKDYLQSSHLTSRYVILHRLALHNWLPSAHFHTVGKLLAGFLFRIGTKM
ncbi:PREDICTED: uncharacterized protein LOC109159787 [Ipomoea nil]|uniref:uncharacterized protein LOC109159787 n=1 Tax=Ipomoea nil TaxID=35883 RepID=UPI0009010844|nr:PREDICTED: uncharacterized protein LOC109159787 [Ipomoea nil]